VLGKLSKEGDTLLVGKLLGLGALGIYDIAFRFVNLANRQLGQIISNIALPVFAQRREDFSVTRERYLKMLMVLAMVYIYSVFCTFVVTSCLFILVLWTCWRLYCCYSDTYSRLFCAFSYYKSPY